MTYYITGFPCCQTLPPNLLLYTDGITAYGVPTHRIAADRALRLNGVVRNTVTADCGAALRFQIREGINHIFIIVCHFNRVTLRYITGFAEGKHMCSHVLRVGNRRITLIQVVLVYLCSVRSLNGNRRTLFLIRSPGNIIIRSSCVYALDEVGIL